MFKLFDTTKPERLDLLIDNVTDTLLTMDTSSEEYDETLAYLERLTALRGEPTKRISRDTMAMIIGNLLGILIIVAYEQHHPMTSKAFGWIKPKN